MEEVKTDVQNKVYDPEDVTTWSPLQFDSKCSEKIKLYYSRIETAKNLLMQGKQILAYQYLQGLGDGMAKLIDIYKLRTDGYNENSPN